MSQRINISDLLALQNAEIFFYRSIYLYNNQLSRLLLNTLTSFAMQGDVFGYLRIGILSKMNKNK